MSSGFNSIAQPISGGWGNPSPDYFKKVTPNRDVFSPKEPRRRKENDANRPVVQTQLAKRVAERVAGAKERFFQHSCPTRAVSPIPRGKSPLSKVQLPLEEQEEFPSPGMLPAPPSRDPSPFMLQKAFLSPSISPFPAPKVPSPFLLEKVRLAPSIGPFPGARVPSPLQLDAVALSLE